MGQSPIRALLIEDNPGDVVLIREALSDVANCAITLESRSLLSTGLLRLAEGGIDVLILDLSLPDSHGIDTVTRAFSAGSNVPMVVLTGMENHDIAVKAIAAGAQDFLLKSRMDGETLARSLRYAIQRQHIQAKLREARTKPPTREMPGVAKAATASRFPFEDQGRAYLSDLQRVVLSRQMREWVAQGNGHSTEGDRLRLYSGFRLMGVRLAELAAGPGDVLQLVASALNKSANGEGPSASHERRLSCYCALELMAHLVNAYRESFISEER